MTIWAQIGVLLADLALLGLPPAFALWVGWRGWLLVHPLSATSGAFASPPRPHRVRGVLAGVLLFALAAFVLWNWWYIAMSILGR